jgi:hypothetical protein
MIFCGCVTNRLSDQQQFEYIKRFLPSKSDVNITKTLKCLSTRHWKSVFIRISGDDDELSDISNEINPCHSVMLMGSTVLKTHDLSPKFLSPDYDHLFVGLLEKYLSHWIRQTGTFSGMWQSRFLLKILLDWRAAIVATLMWSSFSSGRFAFETPRKGLSDRPKPWDETEIHSLGFVMDQVNLIWNIPRKYPHLEKMLDYREEWYDATILHWWMICNW